MSNKVRDANLKLLKLPHEEKQARAHKHPEPSALTFKDLLSFPGKPSKAAPQTPFFDASDKYELLIS